MRIIDDIGQDGFTNMAVDEVLFDGFLRGESPPTFRFYTFSPRAITLGYSQKAEDLDLEHLSRMGIEFVRRPTGGRAVIHEGDLTFSLVGSEEDPLFGGSTLETYRKVSMVFANALLKMGIEARLSKNDVRKPACRLASRRSRGQAGTNHPSRSSLCFSSPSRYELLVKGEKVLGSAQMRRDGGFLLQGSFRVEEAERDLHSLFRKNGSLLPKSLTEILGTKVGVSRIKQLMGEELGNGWQRGRLSGREMEKVDLYRVKYASREWNLKLCSLHVKKDLTIV